MKLPTLLLTGAVCFVAPFKSLSTESSSPSIYGSDDRIEISQIADENIKKMSGAVALITNAKFISPVRATDGSITDNYTGNFFSSDLPFDGLLHNDVRRFSDQATAGYCSGFLIDDTHILTAGHCIVYSDPCDSMRIIFDYTADPTIVGKQKPIIPAKNIKTCSKLLYAPNVNSYDGADFGVIELSEAQTDRPRFTLTKATRKPIIGTTVAMLGHPSGKPMKYTAGGAQVLRDYVGIRKHSIVSPYEFVTNLDAFSGNSGSVVFNPITLEALGILVSGASDEQVTGIKISDQLYPQFPNVKDINNEENIQGERVTSISAIQSELIDTLAGKNSTPSTRAFSITVPENNKP